MWIRQLHLRPCVLCLYFVHVLSFYRRLRVRAVDEAGNGNFKETALRLQHGSFGVLVISTLKIPRKTPRKRMFIWHVSSFPRKEALTKVGTWVSQVLKTQRPNTLNQYTRKNGLRVIRNQLISILLQFQSIHLQEFLLRNELQGTPPEGCLKIWFPGIFHTLFTRYWWASLSIFWKICLLRR